MKNKPTGEGTGLGLSLNYDIVKAHGGQLKVETKEASQPVPVRTGMTRSGVGRCRVYY